MVRPHFGRFARISGNRRKSEETGSRCLGMAY